MASVLCKNGHKMTLWTKQGGYRCDARTEQGGCLSKTDVTGTPRYRCQQCDFDYCGPCYQARLANAKYVVGEKAQTQWTDSKWYGVTVVRDAGLDNYDVKWDDGGLLYPNCPASKMRKVMGATASIPPPPPSAENKPLTSIFAAGKTTAAAEKLAKEEEDAARIAKEKADTERIVKEKADAERIAKVQAEANAEKKRLAEKAEKDKADALRAIQAAEEMQKRARAAEEKRLLEAAAEAEKARQSVLHNHAKLESRNPSIGLYSYKASKNSNPWLASASLGIYANNGMGKKTNLPKSLQTPSIGLYGYHGNI